MKKPTMQDIADVLSVSRITVWKALNNREGVSDQLRDKILETAGEMGYFRAQPLPSNMPPDSPDLPSLAGKTIAAVVSRPESSAFWMQIIHHIAKELAAHGASLMYTYLPTYYTSSYHFPQSFFNGEVSGIIVLNVYDETFLRMLTKLSVPKVFLDTTPGLPFQELGGDLLMIEGRDSVRAITRRLLDKGYSRIAFVGDVAYAQTNTDRYNGYLDAFSERNREADPELAMTKALGLKTHYAEISSFLDGLSALPEAVVCVSDYIAHFIWQYCQEKNIPKEKRPLLTGFDNSSEYGNVAGRITTVNVDTIALGTRLASKILFAAEHRKAAHEVSYLATTVIFRNPL